MKVDLGVLPMESLESTIVHSKKYVMNTMESITESAKSLSLYIKTIVNMCLKQSEIKKIIFVFDQAHNSSMLN